MHDESELAQKLASLSSNLWPLAIVALATTCRFLMIPELQSLFQWVKGFIFALFMGLLAHLAAKELQLSEYMWAASIAVAAFFADHILKGVTRLGEAFAKDPFVIISWLEKLRK